MLAGVYDEIINVNELWPLVQFRSLNGNTLTYNRESTHPTASVFTIGSLLSDSEPVLVQKTAALKEVYWQGPVDLFAQQTLSNVQSQEAVVIMQGLRAVFEEVSRLLIKGDSAVNTMEFDGLDKITRVETRMMAMDDGAVDGPGTAETELTLDRLDQMIHQVKPGKPAALVMNRTMKRKLSSLSRATGSGILVNDRNEFGMMVTFYDGIPIIENDHISNAETYADSGTWPSSTATTIFGVKFGEEQQGLDVLHSGEVLRPQVQRIGIKETKNEELFRVVVYLGSALYSTKSVIALGGIDSAS